MLKCRRKESVCKRDRKERGKGRRVERERNGRVDGHPHDSTSQEGGGETEKVGVSPQRWVVRKA